MTPEARPAAARLTTALLTAGVVGGSLITAVSLTLALVRPGFDLSRHANSMLVLGDWGWIQTVNFIVCGLLLIGFGAGIWRVASDAWSGRVAAICVALYGLLAGVVVGLSPTDPGFGFPPGAPPGYPGVEGLSASAKIHGAAWVSWPSPSDASRWQGISRVWGIGPGRDCRPWSASPCCRWVRTWASTPVRGAGRSTMSRRGSAGRRCGCSSWPWRCDCCAHIATHTSAPSSSTGHSSVTCPKATRSAPAGNLVSRLDSMSCTCSGWKNVHTRPITR
ncbi:DUF998 domain-containing protein [Mycobacterium sp. 20091114027_K0903767]|nr:DUF998 domain-containing protein [Mycobacterium sp. 20091114027_K0903767]